MLRGIVLDIGSDLRCVRLPGHELSERRPPVHSSVFDPSALLFTSHGHRIQGDEELRGVAREPDAEVVDDAHAVDAARP